ncbi:MAG: LON peptidase substrate-binding domain-containing protein [Isosphaeraceae bacterium]
MRDGFDRPGSESRVRLFPLPGVVLFPHAVLPLHIFEPRYRQMITHALADDHLIAMVRLREPLECLDEGQSAIEEVACLGRIIRHEPLPDGRFNLLLLGLKRVRLVRELPASTLYRQAEVKVLEDNEPSANVEPMRTELIERFVALAADQGIHESGLCQMLSPDLPLGPLTDLIAHAMAGLPSVVKQKLLDEPRADRRLDLLNSHLRELVGFSPRGRRSYPPPVSRN